MRARRSRRAALTSSTLSLLLVLGCAFAGCGSPRPPPIFSVDQVRYWFEDDLLIINVSLTNRANFTPGQPNTPNPDLSVTVTDYSAVDDWKTAKPWKQTKLESFQSRGIFLETNGNAPWQKRYYSDEARPKGTLDYGSPGSIAIDPGKSVSVEFGFRPQHEFHEISGYYLLEVDMTVLNLQGESAGTQFWSGCINHDTGEFYAKSPVEGPACPTYDETGRDTESGLSLFGEEHAGVPRMIHDPPPGVAGAH